MKHVLSLLISQELLLFCIGFALVIILLVQLALEVLLKLGEGLLIHKLQHRTTFSLLHTTVPWLFS